MNALEAASLVMIPSGYEDGTLGSLKPTDGTGDFTFTRGSNISATRVNSDGYIEKGYENLLLQSNSFTTTWLQTDLTATSGQSGYDGSNDAWLLSKSAANGRIRQYVTDTGIQTLSAYFKAGTNNWMRITYGGATTYFDLANGVLGSDNSIDATITSIGSGWYRCTFTANVTSAQYAQFYVADANGDTSGTTGSVYIQDAMLNQGMVSYPYVETTTAPVAGGILEDMPRLDYSNGSCPSLLLEPSRTNLIRHSEYFSDNLWSGRAQVTDNAIISPEGKKNAALLYDTSLSGTLSYIRATSTGATTIGATYTLSLYVKPKGNSRNFKFWARNTDAPATFFDVVDGTTSEPSTSTIEAVGDGWFRVSSTGQLVSGTLAAYFYVYTDADNVEGFYVYGAQVEQDATYPTSYIPTYGVSQTRLEDDCLKTGISSLIGQTEGTLFIEWEQQLSDDVYAMFGLNDGSNNNRVHLALNQSGSSRLGLVYRVNGTAHFSDVNIQSLNVGTIYLAAVVYTQTTLKMYLNGSIVVDYSGFSASGGTFNELNFKLQSSGSSFPFAMPTNQALVFPTALSDEACIELTTI
jgi:hypothetical protein